MLTFEYLTMNSRVQYYLLLEIVFIYGITGNKYFTNGPIQNNVPLQYRRTKRIHEMNNKVEWRHVLWKSNLLMSCKNVNYTCYTNNINKHISQFHF